MDQELKDKGKGVERTHNTPTFAPQVDIYEKKDAMVLVADMPGVDEKAVNIDFEKGVLTITGHVEQKEFEGYRPIYAEYRTGDYERSFTVPEEVNVDKIEACVKNGVLKLTLPYAPEPEPKKINIKVG